MIDVAFITNEPTPYRLHLLGRLARELPGVRLHCPFTSPKGQTTMPWAVDLAEEIRPVFFPSAYPMGSRVGYGQARRLRDEMVAYLTEHRVKLIALHGYGDLTRLMLIRWAERAGVPLLVRGDSNLYDDRRKGPVKRFVKRRLLRWVNDHAAGLMPFGAAGRIYFRHYADHRKPVFLCPVEPDYAKWQQCPAEQIAAVAQRLGWTVDRKRLLYSGRMVPIKRVDVLLDAFAAIAEARPHWDLVLAGDGPQRKELEARVPAGLRGRVQWLGFQQADDLAAIYRGCDVLAHPAEVEPWGLIIQEATAAGLPIVTTDVVGAAVELVQHRMNGLLVPPGDAKMFAAALREVTQPGTAEAMAAEAPVVLERWRRTADPVQGVRDALRHFGLVDEPAAAPPASA